MAVFQIKAIAIRIVKAQISYNRGLLQIGLLHPEALYILILQRPKLGAALRSTGNKEY